MQRGKRISSIMQAEVKADLKTMTPKEVAAKHNISLISVSRIKNRKLKQTSTHRANGSKPIVTITNSKLTKLVSEFEKTAKHLEELKKQIHQEIFE